MKPSEIREGFYYSKKGDPNWLRYVLNIDKRVVLYVEWLGYQACQIETIAKLERLQKATNSGAWIWNEKERAAPVTAMDAVKTSIRFRRFPELPAQRNAAAPLSAAACSAQPKHAPWPTTAYNRPRPVTRSVMEEPLR